MEFDPKKIPLATYANVLQRTEKGLAFERKLKSLRDTTEGKEIAKQVIAELKTKAVQPGAVHDNTFLTEFSVQYANDEFIGERLMPVAMVPHRSNTFATYTKKDRFGVADDTIGPDGDAVEVSETRGSDNYSVTDRAAQAHVPQETLENQDPVFDELLDCTQSVMNRLHLNRELRIAAKVTTAGNYATGNKVTLSGSDQWSTSGGGNPIKDLQTAKAALFKGANPTRTIGVCSLDIYNQLIRHPQLLDLWKYTQGGLVTPQQLAAALELDELLVGKARYDTANEGQTASYSRIWGNYFAVLSVAQRPSRRSVHFGTTFMLNGDPRTMTWFDEKKGKAGATYVKSGWSDDFKIVCSDAGYLITSPIA